MNTTASTPVILSGDAALETASDGEAVAPAAAAAGTPPPLPRPAARRPRCTCAP